jgi:hypothetical protein
MPVLRLEMKKYFVNIRIMGMRELKSSGITPVKRAYAIFDVESL